MSSSSNIQQGITEMIKNLQLRNELEGEHVTQLTTIQENLGKINELIREKMLLDNKNVKILEDIDKMLEERNERYEEEAKLRKEAIEDEEKYKKIIEEIEKRQKAIADIKKAAWAGAAAGAISALGTTISTVFKAGKVIVEAFIDVMKKVGEAAFNIGKSLLMLPWNMFKSLVSAAANAQGSTELLDRIEDIRKEWGSFSNAMSADVLKASTLGINLKQGAVAQMQFYKETLAPGRSMMRVWQSLPEMMKDITKTLSSLGPTINLVMNQFNNPETFKSIVAMKKGLGLTDDEFKALAEHTMANGKKIEDSMYEIGNLSLQLGDKFGVSSKKISSDVGKMMKDLGNFGNLTEKQMTAAATQFNRLGVEVSKVTGMMDKFDEFENAADASSKLSQAFGLQLDSMELMRAEDPAERQQMLADAMNRAGVSTDGMRKQSLKLLATTMGLDAATTKTMFSSANLGKSYNDVKNAADEASQKQLSQEEVLKRLADAIEKVNRTGNQLKDGFFKTFLDGIEKGIQRTPSYINMMTNLRRGLHATLWQGIGVGETITKTLGLDDAFNALGDYFKSDNMKKFFGNEGIGGVFKKIFNKDATKKDVDDAFNQLINTFTDKQGDFMTKVYPKLQALGETFGKIGKFIIEKIGEGIGKAFKGGAKLLKGESLESNLMETFQNSPWGKFITPVWEGLKSAFLSMFDGFAEIAPVLLEKVIKAITWIFKGIEYLLASKERRKALDATSATGSYLSFDTTKKKGPQSDLEKQFEASFDKLSSGVTTVFNDDKIWKPLKDALNGAWEELKIKFKEAWDFVAPYIKSFLAANLVLQIGKGVLTGAVAGVMRGAAESGGFGKYALKLSGKGPITEAESAAGMTVTKKLFPKAAAAAEKAAASVVGKTALKAIPLVGEVIMVIDALTSFASKKQDLKKKFEENENIANAAGAAAWASLLNVLTLGLMSDDTLMVFGEWAENTAESMMEGLGGFGSSLGDMFSSLSGIFEGVGDMINAIFEIFDPDAKAWDTFQFGFMKLAANVVKLFISVGDAIMNAVVSMVNFLIEKIKNILPESLMPDSLKNFKGFGEFNNASIMDDAIKTIESQQEASRKFNEENIRRKSDDGLLTKERKTVEEAEKAIQKLEENEKKGNVSAANLVAINQRKLAKQNEVLETLKSALGKEQSEDHKRILQKKIDEITSNIAKTTQDLANAEINKRHGSTKQGTTAQGATTQQATGAAQQMPAQNEMPFGPPLPPPTTSSQGTTAQQANIVSPINQTIEETKKVVEDTKQTLATSSENNKKIADTNSDISVNTGKIVVNLKNNHDALMEGINSIKTSTRNVNVQVAVAVELNVKDLERAIVKQNDSLIRKAVSIIENNISPTSKPNTSEKPVSRGGDIATEAFDKGT